MLGKWVTCTSSFYNRWLALPREVEGSKQEWGSDAKCMTDATALSKLAIECVPPTFFSWSFMGNSECICIRKRFYQLSEAEEGNSTRGTLVAERKVSSLRLLTDLKSKKGWLSPSEVCQWANSSSLNKSDVLNVNGIALICAQFSEIITQIIGHNLFCPFWTLDVVDQGFSFFPRENCCMLKRSSLFWGLCYYLVGDAEPGLSISL